ncbi:hypothetical protein D3C85_1011280 [compost metagenome]
MADGQLAIEGGEGGNEAGGGVAMDQHDIRLHPLVGFVQMFQQLLGQTIEGLALSHHLQVFVDHQLERVEHLLEHLPVLAGRADVQFDTGPVTQDSSKGCHLDGFRPCSEHHHDFEGHEPSLDNTRHHASPLLRLFITCRLNKAVGWGVVQLGYF